MILSSLKNTDPDEITVWMINYLAEQMTKAELGSETAVKNCIEMILKLWKNRTTLPDGARPFENFEPIFRALGSLDPESSEYRYINYSDDVGQSKSNSDISTWLEMAMILDKTTRTLMTFLIEQAADDAMDDKTRDWVKTLSGAVLSHEVTFIVRHLESKLPSKREQHIKNLEKKLEQIRVFEDICAPIRHSLEEELKTLKKVDIDY